MRRSLISLLTFLIVLALMATGAYTGALALASPPTRRQNTADALRSATAQATTTTTLCDTLAAATKPTIFAYEWNDKTWNPSVSGYGPTLEHLRRLGVTDLVVDITRAITLERAGSPQYVPYLATFRQLVSKASANGIVVHAVMGDPRWTLTDTSAPLEGVSIVHRMDAMTGGRSPAGLEFDVEPFSLPGWPTHEVQYSTSYVAFVKAVSAAWVKAGVPGSLGFAVPYWLDGSVHAAPLITWGGARAYPMTFVLQILRPVHGAYLNVMVYRNNPNGPSGSAACYAGVIGPATSSKSPVRLMLGQDLTDSPPLSTTFYNKPWPDLQADLRQLETQFGTKMIFGGFELNDAEGLIALPEAPG